MKMKIIISDSDDIEFHLDEGTGVSKKAHSEICHFALLFENNKIAKQAMKGGCSVLWKSYIYVIKFRDTFRIVFRFPLVTCTYRSREREREKESR